MKLLYLIDELESLAAGGTERQLLQHVEMVSGSGIEPQICVLRNTTWLTEETAGCPVMHFNVFGFRSPGSYREVLALVRWMRRERFDIVHTFFADANVLGPILARLAGVPVVVGGRRNLNEWMTPARKIAQRLSSKLATRLLANSEVAKAAVSASERVSPGKIDVLYNGIDVERFAPKRKERESTRARFGFSRNEVVVLNASGLRHVKGVDIFLRAAAAVCRVRDDVRFVVVGDGPLSGELKALAGDLGIENKVSFEGAQLNINPYFQAADIGVLSSRAEGFSNSLLEYMAAELPTVATNVGGNAEAIRDCGILVDSESPEQLASAILKLAADEESRRNLGIAARNRAAEFTVANARHRLIQYYRSLITGQHGGGLQLSIAASLQHDLCGESEPMSLGRRSAAGGVRW